MTLREACEGGVSGDAEHERAGHGEEHAGVRDDTPSLRRRLDERVVDEERVVVAHVGYGRGKTSCIGYGRGKT